MNILYLIALPIFQLLDFRSKENQEPFSWKLELNHINIKGLQGQTMLRAGPR